MADLIGADVGVVKMFRWTGETTTLNSSFSTSTIDTLPRGVEWDGTDLLWSGSQAGKGYRGTGFGLTIQASYSTGDVSATRAMTWDASNSMDFQLNIDRWRLRSGFTASVTSSFTKATNLVNGSWDVSAADLLTSDNVDEKHRQHDGFSATITTSFSTSLTQVLGMTENASNEFIDSATANNDKVRKRAVFTSTILSSWTPTQGTARHDVAWDGRFAAVSTVVSDAIGMGIIPFAR